MAAVETVQGHESHRDSVFTTVPKSNGPEASRRARRERHRIVRRGRHLAGDVVALAETGSYDPSTMSSADNDTKAHDWSPEQKVAFVLESAAVANAELGALLRRRGVLEAQLDEWRKQVTDGAVASMRPPTRGDREAAAADSKKIRQLERELLRKDKALAETAALLVLKKKAQAIWRDEDDDTDPKSDK